jgi:hypothetical protein
MSEIQEPLSDEGQLEQILKDVEEAVAGLPEPLREQVNEIADIFSRRCAELGAAGSIALALCGARLAAGKVSPPAPEPEESNIIRPPKGFVL